MQDLKDAVSRIAQFLGKPLDTKVIDNIADKCLFKNMKQNKMSNYSAVPQAIMDQTKSGFFRKGMSQHFHAKKNVFVSSNQKLLLSQPFLPLCFRNCWGLEEPANSGRSGVL